MAVARKVSGSAVTGTGTSLAPSWPTNVVGDVAMLTVAAVGTVTTPSGWTVVASDASITSAHLYVFWKYISAVQSGTVAVTTTTGAAVAQITMYGGAAPVAPVGSVGTKSSTTTTTVTSASTTFGGGYAFMAVTTSVATTTLTSEASTAGSWVPSEALDSAVTKSLAIVDGAITAGTTTTLTATSSANSANTVITVPLSASVLASPAFTGTGTLVAAAGTTAVDAFTGTDGSTPASPWVVRANTVQIQGNAAQFTSGTTAYAAARLDYAGQRFGDTDVRVGFTVGAVGVEEYLGITMNGDGNTVSSDGAWAPANGYEAVWWGSTSELHIQQSLNGSTDAGSIATGVTLTAGTPYWLRFQRVGSTLNAKLWAQSAAEPGTWTVTRTISGTPLTGETGLTFDNGGDAVQRTATFDNWSLSASPAALNFAGSPALAGSGTLDAGTPTPRLVGAASLSGSGTLTSAVPSLIWSFTGSSLSPTTAPNGFTGSAITAGAGVNSAAVQTALGYSSDPVLQVSPKASENNPAQSVTAGAYFSFDVTVPAGVTWNPSTIIFNGARGGASTVRGVQFAKSDGTLLGSQIDFATQRPTWTTYTADISALGPQAGGTTVTIRCYTYAPANANTVEMDDIAVALVTTPVTSPILSGTGTLAASSTVSVGTAAGLSGSGTLASVGTPAIAVAAPLTGSGALTSVATPTVPQAAPLSGTGTLTSVATPKPSQAAPLSGPGSLSTGTPVPGLVGTAALSGSGALAIKTVLPLANTVVGTDTTAITPANSGSGGDPFDTVNLGTGTVITYSADTSISGGTAAKIVYPDFQTGYLSWNLAPATATTRVAVRAYVNFGSAAAGTTEQLVYIRNSAGQITQVGLNSTGKWIATAKAGVTIGTSAVTPTINTWYRIEVAVTPGLGTTDGVVEIAVYPGHSLTADWTITSSSQDLGTTAVQAVRFGRSLTTANARTHYFDDLGADANKAAGFLGPTNVPVALSGAGSLSTVGAPKTSQAAPLSGSGSLSLGTPVPLAIASAPLSGSGTLNATPGSGAITETWTGANGTSWPSPWATSTFDSAGATATISSNQGLMTTGSATGSGIRGYLPSVGGGDVDAIIFWTNQSQNNATSIFAINADNTSSVTNSSLYPQNGYLLEIDAQGATGFGRVYLMKMLADTNSILANTGLTLTFTAGVTYGFHLQRTGNTIRWRYWDASGAEPATWTASVTDAGTKPSSTGLLLALEQNNSATVCSVAWDNLSAFGTVTPGVSTGTSPALTGAGTLAASPNIAIATAPALTGIGTLATSSTVSAGTAVGLSGSGTLAAISTVATTGSVSFAGSGSLAATAAPGTTASVSLASSGSLTTAAQPAIARTAALSGSGALTASAAAATSSAVVLTGTGTLSALATPRSSAAVDLSGSGALAATATPAAPAPAAFTGSGALTSATATSGSAVAGLSGTGTLSARLVTTLTNALVGTDGTTITTGNSAAGGDAFNTVNIGSGVAVTYSGTTSISGTAAKVAYIDAQTGYLSWNLSPSTATSRTVVRAYVNFGSVIAGGGEQFVMVRNSAGQITNVGLNSTGKWFVSAKAGTSVYTGATASIDTWYRIEVAVTPGVDAVTGVIEVQVFQGHSLTPEFTLASTTQDLGTTPITAVRFGRSITTGNARTHYYDDLAANANYPSGWLGPSVWPVAFSGSGALAATGVPQPTVAPALSGSGSLTVQVANPAALSGSGSLTLTSRAGTSVTVPFAGSGSLTVVGKPAESSTDTFSGSGALTATGGATVTTTAAFSGSGDLVADGALAAAELVAFTGAGTLVAVGIVQRSPRDTDLLVGRLYTRDLGIELAGHPVAATTRGTPVSVTAHARDLPVTLHGDPVTAKASL